MIDNIETLIDMENFNNYFLLRQVRLQMMNFEFLMKEEFIISYQIMNLSVFE